MLLLTTHTLPKNIEIEEIIGLVEITTPVKIGEKPSIFNALSSKGNDHQDAIENLKKAIRNNGGNAGIGVNLTTATGEFSNGTFLYLSYTATAIRVKTNVKG